MTWQTGTTAATNSYRDFLQSIVAVMTSQHISVAVLNNVGTGYTAGDILTITHAGAAEDAKIEVLTIGGGGAIATFKLRSGGAFSNRLTAAAVNAVGSGYAVGNILRINGGTATENAKIKVLTLSGSAVATAAIYETGGAYSSAPGLTGATSTGIGPAAFAGNNAATFNLTMSGLIGTTGIAVTGGTGTTATFDLTLVDTGWTVVQDTNNATQNGITDERRVWLRGTVAGGDVPYVGFYSYTATSGVETRRGFAQFGARSVNPSLLFEAMPGIGPAAGVPVASGGVHTLVTEAAREWWIGADEVHVRGAIRGTITTVAYNQLYCGFGNRFGGQTTSPFPMIIAGCSATANTLADSSANTGLSECFIASGSAPCYHYRKDTGLWQAITNGLNTGQQDQFVMWPVCTLAQSSANSGLRQLANDGAFTYATGVFGGNTRANVTKLMFPAPSSGDDVFVMLPLTIIQEANQADNTPQVYIAEELRGTFWFPGVKSDGNTVGNEDFFDDPVSGKRYRIFGNATQLTAAKPYEITVFAEE